MNLIGDQDHIQHWVAPPEDKFKTALPDDVREWEMAHFPPLMSCESIPQEWLKNYPGFVILSVTEVPSHYPLWILSPFPTTERRYYQLRIHRQFDRHELITFGDISVPQEIAKDYEHIIYTSYRTGKLQQTFGYVNPHTFVLEPTYFCDFYDPHFGKGQTYTALHIKVLFSGGFIYGLPSYNKDFIVDQFDYWNWSWDIFDETK